MSKTNFTKVEEALDKGLEQRAADHLLAKTGKTVLPQASEEQRLFLRRLQHELKWLLKRHDEFHKILGLSKEELSQLIHRKPEPFSDQEWAQLQELEKACEKARAEVEKGKTAVSNEGIVQKERKRHLNKRFNVSDKWLPLK